MTRPVSRRRARRYAGSTPNGSSISWSPPTTSSATPSRSPSDDLVVLSRPEGLQACSSVKQASSCAPVSTVSSTRQHRLCHARQAAQTAVSQQGRAPARLSNARRTDQHQLFRKRHPRLRHEKKNLRGTVSDKAAMRATSCWPLAKNLHEVEMSSTNSSAPASASQGQKSRPSQASSGQPPHNPTSLAREFAPFTRMVYLFCCLQAFFFIILLYLPS